ncbi:ABC transporter permease subunit [Sinorhizobium sp. B11]|jgi:putative spermidine/putrescine transport system permease protein|uniref:Spermidine/putrescine transport system permease protein n=1 Tax=Rhizobium viscosum TaxID=1673 RepID=A0ABR9IQW8_RHIVS|nr:MULTISPECIES: ABC transporter permease subunit [Rhizobium]MBB3442312.1 putative spermidine/putrescine transport system permease protein [Rhizobium sp. BK379]MBB3559806.1 putative spermidine/putrescine transport system permease protein [Rhizobium sp. BK512]MBE1505588.1 putative spermidine/putrescine transport system permease protein [Rhizobium viscosum]
MIRDQGLTSKIWRIAVWALATLFVLNLLAVIAAVIVNSFATRWLGTWLPRGWTDRWYFSAWSEFQLSSVVIVTFEMAFVVVIISGILGVLTAYALARRDFPGKRAIILLFLLPLLIPPLTYGIPLATVLYQLGLGGTFWGVVLINLVPSFPFVVLVMIPFIEQIDPRIEAAARVFGAGTTSLFIRILLPLLLPGMLAALLLVLVRTLAMFELTFLIAGPQTQTLVVSLYYAVFASGVRASQSIDAMAVIYMVTTLFWLIIALQFVNPTQIVARAKQQSAH